MLIRKNLVHDPSDGLVCYTPSKTCQEFEAECNVNNIIDAYARTGIVNHVNNGEPIYGDFSQVPQDYSAALAVIRNAQEEFDKLPSEVRKRFDSDPGKMIAFLQDDNNRDEAIALGLVNPPAEKETFTDTKE